VIHSVIEYCRNRLNVYKSELLVPIPGGYKYGDLALQVGGVSEETVKYGREFCGTSAQE
jgi:hypothetical protein